MVKPKEAAAKESKGAQEAKREELLDAEAKDSPVLSLISKRLRAARKKVKKVEEIEAIKASGREINTDQEESLKGKAKNLANIEELDRLVPLLKEAVAAEVSQKLAAAKAEIEATAAVAAADKAAEEARAIAEAHNIENSKAKALADELRAQVEAAAEKAAADEARRMEEQTAHEARISELQSSEKTGVRQAIARLLQLMYFSKLFAIEGRNEQDYLHQMERDACMSYVADAGEVLQQDDFNAICQFGKLISSRPQGELISHEAALDRCQALALDWVTAAETPIPGINVTVNELVVKFESIIGSGFYTIKPEMKGAHEVNSKGFLDSSVLTPPGRDVGANSFSATSFGQGQPIPPAGAHNIPLQQILGHQPQQIPGERQSSMEHGLTNGFIPYSSGFKPSTNAAYASGLPHSTVQPQVPPLGDVNAQKLARGSTEGPLPTSNFAAGSFSGAAPKQESTTQGTAARAGSGTAPLFSHPMPSADASASTAGTTAAEASDAPADAPSTERKNSYNAPQGVRPRPQPEGGRARGPPRGRGGGRGDFIPRGGGGRRGGPGRGGFRGGRGREGGGPPQPGPPTFAQAAGQY